MEDVKWLEVTLDTTEAELDALCASLGQGLLVWYAARMKNEGRGIGAVRDWLEENKLHLCHWFTVDLSLIHI